MERDEQVGSERPFLTGLAPDVREWLEAVIEVPPLEEPTIALRLYTAGEAPNSTLAIANLKAILGEYPEERFYLEVVDILEDPLRAIADNVLVTPTLVRTSPLPNKRIVGNLSSKATVAAALGLGGNDR